MTGLEVEFANIRLDEGVIRISCKRSSVNDKQSHVALLVRGVSMVVRGLHLRI